MIIELNKVSDDCIKKMQINQEMNISEEEQDEFDFATECHICKKAFGKNCKKVRDHDHRTCG